MYWIMFFVNWIWQKHSQPFRKYIFPSISSERCCWLNEEAELSAQMENSTKNSTFETLSCDCFRQQQRKTSQSSLMVQRRDSSQWQFKVICRRSKSMSFLSLPPLNYLYRERFFFSLQFLFFLFFSITQVEFFDSFFFFSARCCSLVSQLTTVPMTYLLTFHCKFNLFEWFCAFSP